MKTVFVFIVGLLIAIFLIIPNKQAIEQDELFYGVNTIEVEESKEPTKFEKFVMRVVKRTIRSNSLVGNDLFHLSLENSLEGYNEHDF